MTDKDQFTFDDDDDFPATDLGDRKPLSEAELNDDEFPETDLSAVFSDGEHVAEELPEEAAATKGQGGSSPRTRLLLIILLLVVAAGGGAYYFMDLGGTAPAVPTVAVPAQSVPTAVAVPPQPTAEPAAPAATEPVSQPVTVAVPPPPEPAAQEAPVAQPVEKMVAEQPVPAAKSEPAPVAKPEPAPVAKPEPAPVAKPEPAPASAVAAILPAAPVPAAMPAASAMQVEGGAFALDAGSYLLETNRDLLVKKIKKLGYEPMITPINATLDMTRLRLGTFSKDEVQEALAFARTIEPGCYSAPAGDLFVIYAGTFLKSGNIAKLSERFLAEGITVHPEPVQVVRTLSRIRFGSFASKADAETAASEVAKGGLQAAVVKAK